jgi:hypothetical protein
MTTQPALPGWASHWELPLVVLLAAVGFSAIPLVLGEIGISWDALNHHIYLGWTAERPRFDRDFLAASYQSYQYPYLYWPVYKLSALGLSGSQAGVMLALLHLVAVPPVWMVAHTCMPGGGAFGAFMRTMAVALAFMTGIVLSLFDSTSNDLLAAAPLVWAIALALVPWDATAPAWLTRHRAVLLSGACAGIAVAFKLSNGPLAVLFPLLWACLPSGSMWHRMRMVVLGCAATLVGFAVAYAPWGWQLWRHYGNPIYPFDFDWFQALRIALGGQ